VNVTSGSEQIAVTVSGEEISATLSGGGISAEVTGGAGPVGPAGVVYATPPVSYNSATQTVSLSIGSGLSTSGGSLVLAAHQHGISDVSGLQASLDSKPTLADGLIPSAYLPSYVDDVLEYASLAVMPASGESGKVYVAADTGKTYRWSGTTYIEISPSPGSTDSVTEGSVNLYHTAARAAAAAPVQSVAGRTGAVTLSGSDIVSGTLSAFRLPLSGASPGTYTSVTVDSYGRVTSGGLYVVTWDGVSNKPSSFVPSTHFHTASQITDFSSAVVAAAPPTTNASLLTSGTLADARLSGNVPLLVGGLIPSSLLPSYVDDVVEAASLASFPATGEAGKIYVALDSNKNYRWSGSVYVEISPSPGSTDSVAEGSVNLYHTTARAAAASPVQSVAGRTGSITLGVSDVSGAVASSDSRLSDSREWSAETVDQLEAEAGTSTTRRAWTAQRIVQAIAAWWSASAAKTKLDGIASGATANSTDAQLRDRSTHTGTQTASTISDFTTAVVAASPPTTDASLLTSGTVSAARLPAATTTTAGAVVVGSGLSVTSGTVSANVTSVAGRTGAVTIAAADVSGLASVATSGAYSDLSGTPSAYSLLTATGSVLGGVKIGSGITITDGVISVSTSYAAASHTHEASSITDFSAAVAAASPEEVVEYLTAASFPATGNASLLYIATDDGRAYRWVGSQYAEIGPAGAFLPAHTHSASDITSGIIATSLLGGGTASASTWLRGDSSWQSLPTSGTKTLAVFTPQDNQPPSTNFATLDTRGTGIAVLDFDAATDESAVFAGVIPEGATLTSGLVVRITWMATSATSGNCRWGVQWEKTGTDLDSDSFDTATEATGAANGTSGIETVTSITATAIDSLAAGDRFRLKVFRNADDATNDTMTGDAELVAVEVRVA
jgi:hypothetical protein